MYYAFLKKSLYLNRSLSLDLFLCIVNIYFVNKGKIVLNYIIMDIQVIFMGMNISSEKCALNEIQLRKLTFCDNKLRKYY